MQNRRTLGAVFLFELHFRAIKKKKKHWWHKLFILDDYCKAKLIQKETF
jgi:hypothetical protein